MMIQQRKCPHCGAEMHPIETPLLSSWGGEIHHVCFNDNCCYYLASWDVLEQQGIEKTGYRCRMDPRGQCGPLAVWSADALKDLIVSQQTGRKKFPEQAKGTLAYYREEDFAREDETPDLIFYKTPRAVDHLDSLALSTVEDLYARLIPKGSKILDLMASVDSHLTRDLKPDSLTVLGLNQEELDGNPLATERVLHDLNADPRFPFHEDRFDVVINTVSVEYLTHPLEVFYEAVRVLKSHGIFIVVFSNRMFPPKAVNIWKQSTEAQRVDLVKGFFDKTPGLDRGGYFESIGKPRPKDDKYYMLGIPSDPVYAVWGKALK
ncbi:MAG: methyltransferase domain-containing protein [Deltaproteobacteria bacterium]|nr:methyltransferase domain-containing protein [Deltaproteobacteria bacterium]